jgi:hypothetical protein
MNWRQKMTCTIGITIFGEHEKQELAATVEARLPDMQLYQGHSFYDAFYFNGPEDRHRLITVHKRPEDRIDLELDGDGTERRYHL